MSEIILENQQPPQIDFLIDLNGESLYQKWLQLGNEGDHAAFLEWLKGSTGESAYQYAVRVDGFTGTEIAYYAQIGEAIAQTGEDRTATIQHAISTAQDRLATESDREQTGEDRAAAAASALEAQQTLASKEAIANKVTSVSYLSTNDQYPSAKLVYDKSIEDLWYGIQWDINVSSPVCARIGKAELHRELPIQSLIRGCILSDAGDVNYYLDPLDWTKKADGTASDLSGTAGQVMVEIPSHYRMFETFLSLRKCKISQYALPGYTYVPKFYIGAYEATVQRSTLKLSSVVNATADYRGGDNSNWDSLSKSLLGRPASSISRINFRTYARNRGSVNWNMLTYDAYKSLFYLYYVEYANLNSQTAINAAKDVNGYTQGGLGNGVTDLNGTEWSAFNGYNPFVPCGHTNSLGNYSGEITYSAIDFGGTGVTRTTKANRYRGIENPFGHIWKWVDGVNVEIQSVASGNLSRLYVASNPADFSNTGYVNYTLLGNIPRTEGYVKEMILGEIMPANTVGAGSTTFFSDYFYTSIPASGIDLRGVIFGGGAHDGAGAGFGCARASYAPSTASAYFGSRLCFLGA